MSLCQPGIRPEGPLRAGASDAEIKELAANLWRSRTDRYSEQRSEFTGPLPRKVEMYQIGGEPAIRDMEGVEDIYKETAFDPPWTSGLSNEYAKTLLGS